MNHQEKLIESLEFLVTNPEMARASVAFFPKILELNLIKPYINFLDTHQFNNFSIQKDITLIYLKSSYRSDSHDVLMANSLFDELFKLNPQEIERKIRDLAIDPYVSNKEGSILTQLIKIKPSKFYEQMEKIYFLNDKVKQAILIGTLSYENNGSYAFEPKIVNLMKEDYIEHIEENNLNQFLSTFDYSILLNSNISSFILDNLIQDQKLSHYFEKLNKERLFFYEKEADSKLNLSWLHYPNQLSALLFLLQNNDVNEDLFKQTLNQLQPYVKDKMKQAVMKYLDSSGEVDNFIIQVFDSQKTPYLVDFFNIDNKYLKINYVDLARENYSYLKEYFQTINQIYQHEKLFELKHLIPTLLKSDEFFEKDVEKKFLLILDNVLFKNSDKEMIYSNVIKFLNHQPIQNEHTNILREVIEKQYLDVGFQSEAVNTNHKKMKL